MRLLTARVQDFRCVEDSGKFSLADVTCLVGKNESGKTALLKALHKLNPDETAREQFAPAKDYPRRKWRPDTRPPDSPPAIETTWKLDPDELAELQEQYGQGAVTSPEFSLSKGFDNVRRFSIRIDETTIVKHALAALTPEDRKPLGAKRTVPDAIAALQAIANRTAAQEALLKHFKERFPDGAISAVIHTVAARVPTFLYFDEYLTLPGTVSVNAIIERKASKTLTDRDRVFLALLSLAGTTIEKVHTARTFEEFNASLRAVSNQITDQIFRYWTQNRHLDVEIRLDHARESDPAPFNQGWVFRTRINNRRHRADTSFDDRSRGFVWFFSFLVWFYQLRTDHGGNLVILLDEPGLSLHARAQGDLLRYINEQLRPSYQVVYTTHSPFMVDPDDILSARTIEDVVQRDEDTGDDILLGTKVGEEVLSTDPDTVSPLQRALDYELTQTLFVGRNTLLVEGPSDWLYLKWFSKQLERAGKAGLDYRWSLCVVGGIDRIPGFVSLFRGNRLNIAALADKPEKASQRLDNAQRALGEGRLLTMDSYAGQDAADIEDVLGRQFYVALVRQSLDLRSPHDLPVERPQEAPRQVVKEVEEFSALLPPHYPEFSHYLPAEWLFARGDEGCDLPGFGDALARMEVPLPRRQCVDATWAWTVKSPNSRFVEHACQSIGQQASGGGTEFPWLGYTDDACSEQSVLLRDARHAECAEPESVARGGTGSATKV